jgi:serine/threonine protein kinase
LQVIQGYRTDAIEQSIKQDVYSFGIIFFQLLTGVTELYDDKFSSAALNKVVKGARPEYPEGIDVDARDKRLIAACLAHNPADRPSFREVAVQLTRGYIRTADSMRI